MNSESEEIHYFSEKKLPNVPMTIVSATLNEKLYKDYFKHRRIHFLEMPAVAYKGKLIQYTAHSMSRTCIKNYDWENVKSSVDQIIRTLAMNWISFRFVDETKEIYFDKTEGFNEFKGQDICVIGTPHNVPFIYKMM